MHVRYLVLLPLTLLQCIAILVHSVIYDMMRSMQMRGQHRQHNVATGTAGRAGVRPCPILHRKTAVICAAAPSDPYSVLGVKKGADSSEINRAYAQKKYANRSDDAALRKIEDAHSSLMLSAFNQRLKGGGNISKDIKYADSEPLFPWRPKRWDATPKVVMIIGALQLGMAAFGFQSPAMSKVIACMLIGAVGNVMKQNAIAPPPQDASMASDEEAGRAGRNFGRGALLAVLATFAGLLISSVPEISAKYLTFLPQLPNLQTLVVSIKIAGVALSNWLMTAFYY